MDEAAVQLYVAQSSKCDAYAYVDQRAASLDLDARLRDVRHVRLCDRLCDLRDV